MAKNNKGGRPPAVDMFDDRIAEQVKLFGSLAATHEEMANWFQCSVNTIERYMMNENGEFFRVYKKALSDTKQSLRRLQMKLAQEGDRVMLIWLGKQLLGQKEKIEGENSNTNINKTINFIESSD